MWAVYAWNRNLGEKKEFLLPIDFNLRKQDFAMVEIEYIQASVGAAYSCGCQICKLALSSWVTNLKEWLLCRVEEINSNHSEQTVMSAIILGILLITQFG